MAKIAALLLLSAVLAVALTGCLSDQGDDGYCKQNPYARSCYQTPVSPPPSP